MTLQCLAKRFEMLKTRNQKPQKEIVWECSRQVIREWIRTNKAASGILPLSQKFDGDRMLGLKSPISSPRES